MSDLSMSDAALAGAYPESRRPIRHLDYTLLATVTLLAVVALFLIYAATHAFLAAQGYDPMYYVKKQLTWMALGVIVMLLSATFDYRYVKVYGSLFYGVVVLMLVLVRTPLGASSLGAQRWFQFAGFQFTPSEYMKLALVGMLAVYLSELRRRELTFEQVLRATALAGVPMLLVFIQPDIGTSIVLGAILIGMLVVAGAKSRHLLLLAVTGIVLVLIAFQLGFIKQYQIARLTGFLDPKANTQGANYNKTQAEITIGSGGVLGTGYLHGTQTNLNFVPEQQTDFIFTVVGEEFGFVGGVILLALFGVLLWRAYRIALLSKDDFGTYLATGIASMFAIQMFVNIGMTIGIMPITGIPLPFVSYGGSSMIASCAGVGMLLNIHMRRYK
jgi:rod shape determining protein RodA